MFGHSAISENPFSAAVIVETTVVEGVAEASGSSAPVASAAAMAGGSVQAIGASDPVAAGASTVTADASSAGIGEIAAVAGAAIVAETVGSADGASTATATAEDSGLTVPDYTPVGGGGGFGPASVRSDGKRFRTRKDKSHPKVITVRIGDWPEDPQIILGREEDATRESFYRRLEKQPAPEISIEIDEEEQILRAILEMAA